MFFLCFIFPLDILRKMTWKSNKKSIYFIWSIHAPKGLDASNNGDGLMYKYKIMTVPFDIH